MTPDYPNILYVDVIIWKEYILQNRNPVVVDNIDCKNSK